MAYLSYLQNQKFFKKTGCRLQVEHGKKKNKTKKKKAKMRLKR